MKVWKDNIGKTRLVQKIKATGSHYFDKGTLKFFGQRISDFKVKRLGEYTYELSAPSYWDIDGESTLMGISVCLFNIKTNKVTTASKKAYIKTTKKMVIEEA